ncbi:MAG: glycoside hydrolase family 3 N-terminal domain-containing protein [Verrucomicrobiota bacterium]
MDKTWMNTELDIEKRIDLLMAEMTLSEKVGQMTQVVSIHKKPESEIRAGRFGSSLFGSGAWTGNIDDDGSYVHSMNEVQRIAVEESRLGIPLIFGRDVIHGFKTIAPLPLAQAASWDVKKVETAAADAAREAAAVGIHWTFTPMLDIARDPRWGRIVEGFGEDPYLCGELARAAVHGYQGDDLVNPEKIAACAKHFCAYGGSEGGRDYNTVDIGPRSLRDTYLPPFRAAVEAGVATVMSSFNEIDGIPSTANRELLTEILRDEWGFDGFVVSDWNAVQELIRHGIAEDERQAVRLAVEAGLDMCMVCGCYDRHLAELVEDGSVDIAYVDSAVRNILRVKFRIGLFERPYADQSLSAKILLCSEHVARSRELARESMVLLKNDGALPLAPGSDRKYLFCGPMLYARREMCGTWAPDVEDIYVTTFAEALPEFFEDKNQYRMASLNDEALMQARYCDAAVVCLGESNTRSGEAMSTVSLELPPGQQQFLEALNRWKIPIIAVVFAGRPLDVSWLEEHAAAILYAWHPGVEGPRAALDLLCGKQSPCGRLPVTFPRHTGQIPIYYNHKNTGRPVENHPDGEKGAPGLQRYNDEFDSPLFPFGFGLTYTSFEYSDLSLDHTEIPLDGSLTAGVTVANSGNIEAKEVVQLYVRDLAGSVTRPIRELKGFKKIELKPGESRRVTFDLKASDLVFTTLDMTRRTEPGAFKLWIGPDSQSGLETQFTVVDAGSSQ